MNELLKVEKVSVRYGELEAVRGVSLSLKPGETLGLVGESGCGKSSLGRAILALEPVAAGRVAFDGRSVTALKGAALKQFRRQAQMVFQDPFASLNPRMRVGDIVAEALVIHGLGDAEQRRSKVQTMLERVGLSAADMRKFPHEFSGGQRQRVGIARALILEPRVVVCDEPVSALDVSIQAQILLLLKQLQSEMGLSYLFITHDLRVVRHIADEVAVMHRGQVVELGDVETVYANPQQEYTRNLLNSIPGRHRQAA